MDVKKISENDRSLKLLITGIDAALVNGLRRSIMNAVVGYAAETIQVYENSSIMADEMLAHRIGLLPLLVKEKKTKKGDSIKMTLEKEGPGIVYASDIALAHSGVEIADPNVPLVKLKKGQKVKLEIEAIAGTGKEHVKWQPALVSFKQLPKISFEKVKDAHAIARACPPKTVEIKAGKVFLVDPVSFQLYEFLEDRFPNEVEVEYDTNSFVLTIESFQQNNGKEILLQAIEVLTEKNQEFKEALKAL